MARKVLIADDSASIRSILRMTLQFKGYEIVEAVDGKDALRKLEEETFDLAILDIDMPRLTGLELLDKLRKEQKNTTLPIVICSAEIKDGAQAVLERGADAVRRKPISPNELIELVDGMLAEE